MTTNTTSIYRKTGIAGDTQVLLARATDPDTGEPITASDVSLVTVTVTNLEDSTDSTTTEEDVESVIFDELQEDERSEGNEPYNVAVIVSGERISRGVTTYAVVVQIDLNEYLNGYPLLAVYHIQTLSPDA